MTHVLKIYSGGLGVLAGDYLKEASDSNVDMCGVGFLYRYGYFTQTLSMDGQQIANYEAQNFGQLPIDRRMASKSSWTCPTSIIMFMPTFGVSMWVVFPFICWIRTMT